MGRINMGTINMVAANCSNKHHDIRSFFWLLIELVYQCNEASKCVLIKVESKLATKKCFGSKCSLCFKSQHHWKYMAQFQNLKTLKQQDATYRH